MRAETDLLPSVEATSSDPFALKILSNCAESNDPCRANRIEKRTLHPRHSATRGCPGSAASFERPKLKNGLQEWTTKEWHIDPNVNGPLFINTIEGPM
jgi:hypothetical protein